ncbi:M6 family metalloprotease domain-containing protein [Fibrobacter sp. UWH5]|nr:M6 family metalloprotease domain-containing protein [Fibrobacter sp. UWH5]
MFIIMKTSRCPIWVFVWSLILATSVWSIPAPEKNYEVRQPDGTTLTVTKKGDERFHYVESVDGYPMTRDSKGVLRYVGDDGKPSSRKPHKKSDALSKLREQISNPINPDAPAKMDSANTEQSTPSPLRMPAVNPNLKSGEKNVLVVLVQFQDVKFSSENPQAVFDSLLNQEGYKLGGNQGSARDYYVDNSLGIFKPHFDVVGPFTVSNTVANYGELSRNGTMGAQNALKEALDSLKKQNFDFSKYDNDNNRYLDFVHMIFAGFGAHDSKQDSSIWPHKWIFRSPYRVSTSLRKTYYVEPYACSAELDGATNQQDSTTKITSGVGQFLHEFSHLLGLMDLYSNNDTIFTPSTWDLMDAGAYDRLTTKEAAGTVPPNLSAFERLSLGWISTTELNIKGSVKLSGLQNNVALQVTSPKNPDEFFLMEYRSSSGWDKALPTHGMLIWHIDYNKNAWDSAAVNTGVHLHVDIEEASGNGSYQNRTRTPFPGSARVRSFNKFITWGNTDLGVSISNISESRNYSYITFNVDMDADSGSIDLMEGTAEDLMEVPSDSVPVDEEIIDLQVSSSSKAEVEPEPESSSAPWIEIAEEDVAGNRLSQTNFESTQVKTLQVFSMNGQLLFQEEFTGSMPTEKLRHYRQPLMLSVSRNGKKIGHSLFIFRE